jgi:hypothetical protein
VRDDLTGRAEEKVPESVWRPGEGGAGQSITRDPRGFDRLVARFSPDARYLFNNVERLRRALGEDLAHYQAIIVDMPPVPANDVERVNGAAASAACDAVLLVCMSGRVSRNELNDCMDALANAQAKILGTILNDMQNPTLGAELAREARKMRRFFPRMANWLERKANSSVFLN